MRINTGVKFKRNQIEEALSHVFQFGPPIRPELQLEIKRLFDADRRLGVNPRSRTSEFHHLAFISHRPQGTGYNIEYGPYDVFAVCVGIKLLRAGFTQQRVAMLMRRLRPALASKHREILSWDPASLLDNQPSVDLDTTVSAGQLVKTLDNMVCLVLPAGKYSGLTFKTSVNKDLGRPANIAAGKAEIEDRLQSELAFGATPIVIELVNLTYQLAYWLSRTEQVQRGRK